MRKKSTSFIIPLVIYPFDVLVSLGQTDDDFKRAIKKVMDGAMFKEMCDDGIMFPFRNGVQGRTLMLASGQLMIRLRNYPKHPEEYGFLAHEIFHAVTFILDRVNLKFCLESSDEAYAYLVGYLTAEIYKKM